MTVCLLSVGGQLGVGGGAVGPKYAHEVCSHALRRVCSGSGVSAMGRLHLFRCAHGTFPFQRESIHYVDYLQHRHSGKFHTGDQVGDSLKNF